MTGSALETISTVQALREYLDALPGETEIIGLYDSGYGHGAIMASLASDPEWPEEIRLELLVVS